MVRWLALALVATWALQTPAQTQPARVGWALAGSEANSRANVAAFREGMRQAGHVEGRTYVLDLRYAEGQLDRYKALFEDLLRAKPNVLVAGVYQGTLAAASATRTTPIVGVSCGMELLVGSLARPTGNVTGVTCQSPELGLKQVQLFREALPRARRIAVLFNPEVPYAQPEVAELRKVFGALGVTIVDAPVTDASQFERTVAGLRGAVDGVFVVPDNMVYGNRFKLGELLLASRLPMMSGYADFVEAGGLMSYGSDLHALLRRAGWYVDRLLKGANPGDLPVEQPTTFELVVSEKNARTLGVDIPSPLLARADRVLR